MWRATIILLSALTFAAIGLYFGLTLHGPTMRAALACVSGAAGGFGIGLIGWDICRQAQTLHVQKRRVQD